jgi:hypothetical protein
VRKALSLALAFSALSSSAWAQRFTDENGCYTTRKNWERRCQATVNLATDALDAALVRAKEKTTERYAALEQALIRAETGPHVSGRVPGAYRRMKKSQARKSEEE